MPDRDVLAVGRDGWREVLEAPPVYGNVNGHIRQEWCGLSDATLPDQASERGTPMAVTAIHHGSLRVRLLVPDVSFGVA